MGRAALTGLLWVVALMGAVGVAFFTAMLLTPGYGDPAVAVFDGLSGALALGAGLGLVRRARARRAASPPAPVRGETLEVLRPSRRRWGFVGVTSLAFVLLSIGLQVAQGLSGGMVLVGLFFGLGCVVAALQLAPGAAWLRITTEGLVVRHLGRVRTHRWEDLDGFRSYSAGTGLNQQWFVGWESRGGGTRGRRMSWLSRALSGVDDGLPDTYGEDADALAERLQRYRDEHAPARGAAREPVAQKIQRSSS